jgi:hypothetical protein
MRSAIPLALALVACAAPSVGVAPPHSVAAGSVAPSATRAIDEPKCEDRKARIHPFVIDWDATEQAEFSAHVRKSIALVKLDGCKLDVLPQCQVRGEYRLRETSGNSQTLTLASDEQLNAEVPFIAASLSGHLRRTGRLELTYFVRGVAYAGAPVVYRHQLKRGCEGATHFVLNYAAGAFELGTGSGAETGAGARAFSASARGVRTASSDVLLRGGDLSQCGKGDGRRCGAPVRLRLVPVIDDPASSGHQSAPTVSPKLGVPARSDDLDGVEIGGPAFDQCRDALLHGGQDANVDVSLTVSTDGFVTKATAQSRARGAVDAAYVECIQESAMSLRFSPRTRERQITAPYPSEP